MADKSFANSEYIFREGESAAYAYVIKSGTVEITKHSADGEQVLAELVAPTIFGEMALIDGNPRSCLLYTSPSPRDGLLSRMPSSA